MVPKSKPGAYRWILNASYNRDGHSINDRIFDYTTTLVDVRSSLVPGLRTEFMGRIDLTRAFKALENHCADVFAGHRGIRIYFH